ncbi:hypothetical protein JJV70_16320 [Streptomyces sp. JJ66]|uniref:hypothetical protein n=1 Tax=Streptomyces sp. JJ66 TaxID=2803843 RepID=UPI001C59C43A|nr:hypothetical protein [Streptomyces sp. JJ66]MBW1603642.1 hypothetical protein [Streptomyces sp. JJ66]
MTLPVTAHDASGPDPAPHHTPQPLTPHAHCTAHADGTLTLTVPQPATAPPWYAVLLQRRGGHQATDTVHLPLTDPNAGHSTATLTTAALRLTEGRWDVYVARATAPGAPRTRLRPGVGDLRTLADEARAATRGRHTQGAVCIPYTTTYGNLSLRTWLRWPHAEATAVHLADADGTLDGLLLGACLTDDARLEAHALHSTTPPVTGPVRHRGPHFTATVPLADLAHQSPRTGEPTEWELWLRPGAATPSVRVARILDDVPDKRTVYRYPPLTLPDGTTTGFAYTGEGDLSVSVHHPPAP